MSFIVGFALGVASLIAWLYRDEIIAAIKTRLGQ